MATTVPGRSSAQPDRPNRPQRVTFVAMMFDDESEWLRFFNYVEEHYGPTGLRPTNVPIRTSLRVADWLLAETRDLFAIRPVTNEDIEHARAALRKWQPFDPDRLNDLHIPGIPLPDAER